MAKQTTTTSNKNKSSAIGDKKSTAKLTKSASPKKSSAPIKKSAAPVQKKSVINAAKSKKPARLSEQMPLDTGANDANFANSQISHFTEETTMPVTAETNTESKSDQDLLERQSRIQTEAYHIAERDGFQPGRENDYWLQAEQVINQLDENEKRDRTMPLAELPKDVH